MKTIKNKDNQTQRREKQRRPKTKMTKNEDDQKLRRPKMKTRRGDSVRPELIGPFGLVYSFALLLFFNNFEAVYKQELKVCPKSV